MSHNHTCGVCGDSWECHEEVKKKGCAVDEAAQANQQPPVCMLCHYLIMARNIIQFRRKHRTFLEGIQNWPLLEKPFGPKRRRVKP